MGIFRKVHFLPCGNQSVVAALLWENKGIQGNIPQGIWYFAQENGKGIVIRMGKGKGWEKENCCGCQACKDICPAGAIHMYMDGEGFLYPETDEGKCTGCGLCESVCPLKNNSRGSGQELYFGMQAKDDRTRYSSSSGGMFPLLASEVLKKQGVVYGAGYGSRMEVLHKSARNSGQLEGIKRTKYVQSSLDGIYREIQRELEQGHQVLFCGTPCQAQALRLFLGGKDEGLILVDLICYGVASPGIWGDYVKYLERRYKGKMKNFSFRDKRNRDNGHTCSFMIDDREEALPLYQDVFSRMYAGNYSIRPSCHCCRFCKTERSSDFTIGDFWGIEKVRPGFDDGMGNSLVIVHTKKAEELWKELKKETRWFACQKEDVLQPRLQTPTMAAKRRGLFMKAYERLPFSLFINLVGGWKQGRRAKKVL
ncbi:4Fe-4S dicluster domain-containing protein [Lachnospiraceae bacterium]|nr:4Fe-4S dicluster domain-containing protein [Lachnospiraceae bacterium]